jgi:Toprim domain
MTDQINYAALTQIIGHRLGTYDVACPLCGPGRRTPANRHRKVLRVWRGAPGFVTYSCARCGVRGYALANGTEKATCASPPAKNSKLNPKSEQSAVARRDKARWLWGQRQPIKSTPAEVYLREARGYGGPLPATLGFLPARAKSPPAMIAAFGMVDEPEPGVVSIAETAVAGVHLTRLARDGHGKAGTDTDKIMIGTPRGSPLVVAPPDDLCGLAITEGIEDALSVHEATGLGAWAAGAASFMPALAAAVPEWVECITIMVDDDDAGRSNTNALAERLERRGFEVRLVIPG